MGPLLPMTSLRVENTMEGNIPHNFSLITTTSADEMAISLCPGFISNLFITQGWCVSISVRRGERLLWRQRQYLHLLTDKVCFHRLSAEASPNTLGCEHNKRLWDAIKFSVTYLLLTEKEVELMTPRCRSYQNTVFQTPASFRQCDTTWTKLTIF